MSAPTLTFSPAMFHAAHVAKIKTVTRRYLSGGGSISIDYNKLFKDLCLEKTTVRGKDRFRAIATLLRTGHTIDLGPPAHRPGEIKPMVTSWAASTDWDDIKPSDIERDIVEGEIASQISGGIWFNDGSKKPTWAGKTHPGRFLPKALYSLAPQVRILSARPEPLLDITEADATAEGITTITKDNGRTWKYGLADRDGLPGTDDIGWPWSQWKLTARDAYFALWDSLHPDHPAATNPIVWRYEFEPVS